MFVKSIFFRSLRLTSINLRDSIGLCSSSTIQMNVFCFDIDSLRYAGIPGCQTYFSFVYLIICIFLELSVFFRGALGRNMTFNMTNLCFLECRLPTQLVDRRESAAMKVKKVSWSSDFFG